MNVKTLQEMGHTFTYTDHAITLPPAVTRQMLGMLSEWHAVFPYEETFVAREYGVPSIIVRFDGVVTPQGQFDAYEIQAGCGWVGYAGIVNGAFREMRDHFVAHKWPPFKLFGAAEGNPDERYWLERIDLDTAIAGDDLLWIRYNEKKIPKDVRAALIARSVKPVRTHNLKNYGQHLGWWKQVNWHESSHGETLPWHESFVLKPQFGFGSTDIMLWKPNDRSGRATRTQIVHALQKYGWMYLQSFIPPMQINVDGAPYNIIYRPFFGYDPKKKEWVPMHGVWTGRPSPSLRIHGASDSLTGPLLFS